MDWNNVLKVRRDDTYGSRTAGSPRCSPGAGLAIGSPWGGLLANFAAGVFLVMPRPFHVGNFIAAAGTVGVDEAGYS